MEPNEMFTHFGSTPLKKPFISDTLVPIDQVPLKFRNVFSDYIYFNRIQSKVFNDIFYSDDSIVVSAPTGSGKTVLFELAMVKYLSNFDLSSSEVQCKIIYVAPMKALCEEKLLEWHKKFSPNNVNCISATGDSDNVSVSTLINHNVIITTPEKWDALTRRWRENRKFFLSIGLFMIDEVHLLSDETRGSTLEAIMSRMKTIREQQNLRFIAVSATLPNIEDIAEWIGLRAKPAKHFSFSDETRPVKLNTIVHGYPYNAQIQTPFKFDMMLSYKLQYIMLQHSNGKPTLIFCSTRKSVEMTAKHLTQNLTINLNPEQKTILADAANKIEQLGVKEILMHGVGCHHAGMLPENRKIMEDLFRNGDLPVLVTTSTLAMGVNLPAHLVIVKSTKQYREGGYQDYSESQLLQMIGRAGRPQFDTSATAVILTMMTDKVKFEKMIGGKNPVESCLHRNLTEHLNAEVVLKSITDLGVAMNWLNTTFLHIRARKHPKYYGLSAGLTPAQIDQKLLDTCQIEINKLARVGMITVDATGLISPTRIGALMAKYYVHFETMKLFTQVTGKEVLQQILSLISRCHEFSDCCLRVTDKKALNLLNHCKNKQTIRFPLSGKIKTVDMKINCIIQAVFGCLEILEPGLVTEAQKIMKVGERVTSCLTEYLADEPKSFSSLLNSIILSKCFHARLWENSPYVCKQLSGIGAVMSNNLAVAGKTSFASILETNPRNLEMIIHRKPPMGNTLQTLAENLPNYRINFEEIKIASAKSRVKIILRLVNYERLLCSKFTVDPESVMNLLVGDDDNNVLLYEKLTHNFMVQNPVLIKELSPVFNTKLKLNAYFISENWVGFDCKDELNLFSPPNTKEIQNTGTSVKPKNKVDSLKNVCDNRTMKQFIDQYFNVVKTPKYCDASSTPRATSSISRGTSSMSRDTSTISRDICSIPRDTSSISRDTSSISRDTSAMTRDTSPISRDTSKMTRDISSVPREASSIVRDASSIVRDASSISRDASSITPRDTSAPNNRLGVCDASNSRDTSTSRVTSRHVSNLIESSNARATVSTPCDTSTSRITSKVSSGGEASSSVSAKSLAKYVDIEEELLLLETDNEVFNLDEFTNQIDEERLLEETGSENEYKTRKFNENVQSVEFVNEKKIENLNRHEDIIEKFLIENEDDEEMLLINDQMIDEYENAKLHFEGGYLENGNGEVTKIENKMDTSEKMDRDQSDLSNRFDNPKCEIVECKNSNVTAGFQSFGQSTPRISCKEKILSQRENIKLNTQKGKFNFKQVRKGQSASGGLKSSAEMPRTSEDYFHDGNSQFGTSSKKASPEARPEIEESTYLYGNYSRFDFTGQNTSKNQKQDSRQYVNQRLYKNQNQNENEQYAIEKNQYVNGNNQCSNKNNQYLNKNSQYLNKNSQYLNENEQYLNESQNQYLNVSQNQYFNENGNMCAKENQNMWQKKDRSLELKEKFRNENRNMCSNENRILWPNENQNLSSNENSNLSLNENRNISSNKNQNLSSSKNQNLSSNKNQNVSLSKNQNFNSSKNQNVSSSKNQNLSSSKNQNLCRNENQILWPNENMWLNENKNVCSNQNQNPWPHAIQNLWQKKNQNLMSNEEQNLDFNENRNVCLQENRNMWLNENQNQWPNEHKNQSSNRNVNSYENRHTWPSEIRNLCGNENQNLRGNENQNLCGNEIQNMCGNENRNLRGNENRNLCLNENQNRWINQNNNFAELRKSSTSEEGYSYLRQIMANGERNETQRQNRLREDAKSQDAYLRGINRKLNYKNAIDFESSAVYSPEKTSNRLNLNEAFGYQKKKSYQANDSEPDSTNEMLKRQKLDVPDDENFSRKSIKWHSPLVTSPKMKSSPSMWKRNAEQGKRREFKPPQIDFNKGLRGSKTAKSFPITDKECDYTQESAFDRIADILDSPTLNSLKTPRGEKKIIQQDVASYIETTQKANEKPKISSSTETNENRDRNIFEGSDEFQFDEADLTFDSNYFDAPFDGFEASQTFQPQPLFNYYQQAARPEIIPSSFFSPQAQFYSMGGNVPNYYPPIQQRPFVQERYCPYQYQQMDNFNRDSSIRILEPFVQESFFKRFPSQDFNDF